MSSKATVNTQNLRFMMVGGGSGGHLTPLAAVAVVLKQKLPNARVVVVGQRNENLQEAVSHSSIDEVYGISAGKFRRYHGESLIAHIKDIKTIALNVRDFFRFLHGIGEAWRLLGREKPGVILLKGGFVCVPVGIAARLRKIPYITHDSDAIPGLANRLSAKHAHLNTTAMPAQMYPYKPQKTVQVGIPLRPEFTFVTPELQQSFKVKLGLPATSVVIGCIGGGLGAQKLNHALAHMSRELLSIHKNLTLLHVAGHKTYEETIQLYQRQLPAELMERVKVYDFYNDLHELSGASDIMVSRAGATSIAELAIQGKPCVIVPNPVLTGGQQIHNARALSKAGAAIIVDENDFSAIQTAVELLLDSPQKRTELSEHIHAIAYEHSAERIVELLISTLEGTPHGAEADVQNSQVSQNVQDSQSMQKVQPTQES